MTISTVSKDNKQRVLLENKMGIIQNTEKNIFSFLYNAGDINSTTCIMKNGSETINVANNAIFKLIQKPW